MPSVHFRPVFLSLYIFESELGAQPHQYTTSMREQDVHPMHQLTKMHHQLNTYVQMFRSLREFALEDDANTPYKMVIHADFVLPRTC